MGTKNSKKKAKGSAVAKRSAFSPAAIVQFINEVKAEFSKITWPDKKTTLALTSFVFVFVSVMAVYLGSVDLLLGRLVSSVL